MKKKIVSLFIISVLLLLTMTGCQNSVKNEQKGGNSNKTVNTNEQIGNLKYYIPSNLKANTSNTDSLKVYAINNDLSTISVYFVCKKDYSGSVEDYMKQDKWEPDMDKLDKVTYNSHEWYVQGKGETKFYTKFENDIYAIRFTVLQDKSNLKEDLMKVIPKSLLFEK